MDCPAQNGPFFPSFQLNIVMAKILPEETDEGEIASALDGGVGVLVVRATEVVEVVG